MYTKLRNKVRCYCKECNGKYVEERTRKTHADFECCLASSVPGFVPSLPPENNRDKSAHTILEVCHNPIAEGSSKSKKKAKRKENDNNDKSGSDVFASQKRQRQDQFREPKINQYENLFDDESNKPIDGYEDEILPNDDMDDESNKPINRYENEVPSENDMVLDEEEIPIEQFIAPENDLEFEYPDTNINFADSWILIWIFKYQTRFRLSDVAIDSLIKLFRQVLMNADQTRFKDFPSSLHIANKLLQIGSQSKTYAVCPSCNTLYNIVDVVAEEGFKCTHVEFPMKSKAKPCGMEVTMQVPLTNEIKRRPKMLFPLPNLKIQINSLYRRPEFKQQLRKWTNRVIDNDMLADIYDGKIWKNFPDTSDNTYFTPKTADCHLGIMINLDWFQPFESSAYSCGAIYGVICNLPREIRFRKEYMLTLGLLPGPNEVKLHKINHYLSPIVDELLEFWNRVEIPAAGKNIRLALICCSNDIPAARKLCGHISALVGCHRCYKRANSNNENKLNFGGFDDMDDWFIEKDLEEHQRNAKDWRLCRSEEERKRHVSSTHVRWTELLRLPYFNPIRHLVVDPMHCLFLGIAHWIVKKLWIDGGKITKSDLQKMEERAKKIKVPADIGRVPDKIATEKGFSRFTADQ